MSSATAQWGDQIAVETVHGVPYRMYTQRPRRVESLLQYTDRWGDRPPRRERPRFGDDAVAPVAAVGEEE